MEEDEPFDQENQLKIGVENSDLRGSLTLPSPSSLSSRQKSVKKDISKMSDTETFDSIQRALKGTKVIEVPRVSREVYISFFII